MRSDRVRQRLRKARMQCRSASCRLPVLWSTPATARKSHTARQTIMMTRPEMRFHSRLAFCP